MGDREPKEATLELSTEWVGGEGDLLQADFMPNTDGWRIRLTMEGNMIALTEADLETLNEHAQRYKVALHAVRGTQP